MNLLLAPVDKVCSNGAGDVWETSLTAAATQIERSSVQQRGRTFMNRMQR